MSGEGLSEEEDEVQQPDMEMQQLSIFTSNDPTTFEEAAKVQLGEKLWTEKFKLLRRMVHGN